MEETTTAMVQKRRARHRHLEEKRRKRWTWIGESEINVMNKKEKVDESMKEKID
ncbi:uncharacterized protein G2W53_002432 [Senna tora]|uniref:Uncharacterized protein n=1 Tax=Senna tora TaxID=362788 RepID=A0A834XKJ0_9FABA|nr:uncharacterized protein G2W53_002432 [Senna tora]